MHHEEGQGLVVRVADWPNDAESPVCLMIDDLTDGWIDRDGSGRPRGRNDSGAGMDEPGSAFRFLLDGLLGEFPEVRTTFFIPVDRLPDISPSLHRCEYRPIDRRPEFVRFLRALDADPRFECAYHGREHGLPGPTGFDYVPEFERYASVADAVSGLRAGEQIWKGVFERAPTGGKYPAYARGVHGDAALDVSGFTWWCRRWDRDLSDPRDPTAFRPRFFGERGLVDVPSTLHGGLCTRPRLRDLAARDAYYYLLLVLRSRRWLDEQIDALLAQRAVVSLQEHITSARPDRFVQTPNIWDDQPTLRRALTRLRRRRVWHATCGEIAAYYRARELTRVHTRSARSFVVHRAKTELPLAALSLVLNGRALPDAFALRGPDGEQRVRVTHRVGALTSVTEPLFLLEGRYEVR